ncbi:hypothetical protein BRADI_1g02637v3 [Brachypodium distachyon]|uniref:Uncharacterized protein n=1 Tax=Brachypodium distachyon TaxID=15368 RepID=A0A2K2DHT4_BRADI|nr:hypothetical protein BRADI_1g02637v3 [Brachypodium distachyon]
MEGARPLGKKFVQDYYCIFSENCEYAEQQGNFASRAIILGVYRRRKGLIPNPINLPNWQSLTKVWGLHC